ncbi:hypothetical protein CF65_02022 [Aggregatibacter actinomycetemcomitans HK1651]|nr:hypothetical protein CF65_02022 [Aggregatibacter actinomycetemcomitans HK1651]
MQNLINNILTPIYYFCLGLICKKGKYFVTVM